MKMGSEAVRLLEEHRSRILEALERNGPSGVAELPRRWPLTRAAVTHLLEDLEREGAVVRVVRPPSSRATVYARTPEADRPMPLPRAG